MDRIPPMENATKQKEENYKRECEDCQSYYTPDVNGNCLTCDACLLHELTRKSKHVNDRLTSSFWSGIFKK